MADVTGDDGVAALGRAVKARRDAMSLGQGDLYLRGGPGEATVRRLERGVAGEPRPKTRGQLETSLAWPGGTVDAILANGDPSVNEARIDVQDAKVAEIVTANSHLNVAPGDEVYLGEVDSRARILRMIGEVVPGSPVPLQAQRARDAMSVAEAREKEGTQLVDLNSPGMPTYPMDPPIRWRATEQLDETGTLLLQTLMALQRLPGEDVDRARIALADILERRRDEADEADEGSTAST